MAFKLYASGFIDDKLQKRVKTYDLEEAKFAFDGLKMDELQIIGTLRSAEDIEHMIELLKTCKWSFPDERKPGLSG